jgi:uncharacterized protein YceH (UPF0502 family)
VSAAAPVQEDPPTVAIVAAPDDDRIGALEQRVADLEDRLRELHS